MRPQPSPEYPYRFAIRLGLVAFFAELVAIPFGPIQIPSLLLPGVLVSPLLWTGICFFCRSRPNWVFLICGAVSPLLGIPPVLAFQEVLEPGRVSIFGLDDSLSLHQQFGVAFWWGCFLAMPFWIITFPIGMGMGGIAWLFMRRDH